MGRHTLYTPDLCNKILEYFDKEPYKKEVLKKINKDGSKEEKYIEIPIDLPTLAQFAVSIGVHRDTIHEWTRKHEDFADAYKKAKDLQRHILITNGLRGNYQTAFAIFTAKNVAGMRDTIENINKSINLDNLPEEDILRERITELLELRKNDE